jgi:tetratricopeptide (TPR) repeat protein
LASKNTSNTIKYKVIESFLQGNAESSASRADKLEISKLTGAIGACYLLLRRVDLALAAFSDALSNDPDNVLASLYQARTVSHVSVGFLEYQCSDF